MIRTLPRFSSVGHYRKGVLTRLLHSVLYRLLCVRYVPLPKSSQPGRIKSNADVYDFELSEDDISALDKLDKGDEGAVSWNPVRVP